MTLIYGYSEVEERMSREKGDSKKPSCDKRKEKEVADSVSEGKKSNVFRKNNAYAIGGVVKERRGFYGE